MWTLQDAKNRFSAVVEAALAGTPQQVTRRGKPAVVVVVAADECRRLLDGPMQGRGSFADNLMAFPAGGLPDLPRAGGPPGCPFLMYILDTNVISALRRRDRAPRVAAWLRGKPEQDLFLSVITLGEIERGIHQQETRDPAFARDLRAWLDRTTLIFPDRLLAFWPSGPRMHGSRPGWGRLARI
ncbi:type II toxin-antitoxin system prevent-host-death family antitoxin [Szabonella alba]|uniref:type II toxin-antitoxin system prevent-host-death family antitoxin n=1 Tax=Szabonella alba TaxID=2804194 RepID=UPI003080DBA0